MSNALVVGTVFGALYTMGYDFPPAAKALLMLAGMVDVARVILALKRMAEE